LVILSKTPSLANIIKSKSFLNLKTFIFGSAIITKGFPPYFFSFACISPNVLETDNLPGSTLCGPSSYIYVLESLVYFLELI